MRAKQYWLFLKGHESEHVNMESTYVGKVLPTGRKSVDSGFEASPLSLGVGSTGRKAVDAGEKAMLVFGSTGKKSDDVAIGSTVEPWSTGRKSDAGNTCGVGRSDVALATGKKSVESGTPVTVGSSSLPTD